VFAEAHREKIWKKLRRATDGEALRDVRAELQAAHLLVADRRIELAFEAYGSGKAGPDFTVTFRAGQRFNLEVTRLRRVPDATSFGRTLLAKLRQLPPSAPNVLLSPSMDRQPRRSRSRRQPERSGLERTRRTSRSSPIEGSKGREGSTSGICA
jgi:hypothetical protein